MRESILHLTIKRHWFNEISMNRKKTEYREYKPYWKKRLLAKEKQKDVQMHVCKHFDYVEFRNGYRPESPRMKVQCLGIIVAQGDKELGAPDGAAFCIMLGDVINQIF
jgi:hypothetical protein